MRGVESMYDVLKNVIDRVLAMIGIIILLPVFLVLILAIKLDSKGPFGEPGTVYYRSGEIPSQDKPGRAAADHQYSEG